MATEEEGLGGLARRWLRAKRTELLAGTRASQQAASTEAGNAWRDLGDRAASDAMYAAFPGLRRVKDRQDAAKAQQAADARAEVLALPGSRWRSPSPGTSPDRPAARCRCASRCPTVTRRRTSRPR